MLQMDLLILPSKTCQPFCTIFMTLNFTEVGTIIWALKKKKKTDNTEGKKVSLLICLQNNHDSRTVEVVLKLRVKIQSQSPTWVIGTQSLKSSPLPPRVWIRMPEEGTRARS